MERRTKIVLEIRLEWDIFYQISARKIPTLVHVSNKKALEPRCWFQVPSEFQSAEGMSYCSDEE